MAVSTALPTIVGHLNGTDFIWVGSAFTVASTAIIPFVGDLVSGFGRKPVLLAFIVIFAIGSAICGAAQNMNMLIAGRGTLAPYDVSTPHNVQLVLQLSKGSVEEAVSQSRKLSMRTWCLSLNVANSKVLSPAYGH